MLHGLRTIKFHIPRGDRFLKCLTSGNPATRCLRRQKEHRGGNYPPSFPLDTIPPQEDRDYTDGSARAASAGGSLRLCARRDSPNLCRWPSRVPPRSFRLSAQTVFHVAIKAKPWRRPPQGFFRNFSHVVAVQKRDHGTPRALCFQEFVFVKPVATQPLFTFNDVPVAAPGEAYYVTIEEPI